MNDIYNDKFAFFLNGENIAMVNETIPVSINSINSNEASGFFINNNYNGGASQYQIIEADGFTTLLTASSANLNSGAEWNTMRLTLADVADDTIDSYVLL